MTYVTGVWTYDGDPAASPLAAVRFLVGDTVAKEPFIGDAEVEFLLERRGGNVTHAAVDAAHAIAARLTRESDRQNGDVQEKLRGRAADFRRIAAHLEDELAEELADPDAERASDIVFVNNGEPYFALGLHGEAGYPHVHHDGGHGR